MEGIDGSGKTTLANHLKDDPFFKDWEFIREPTEGPYGKEIRNILKDSETKRPPEELTRLFIDDRLWNNENIIKKLIEKNKNIICDRYYFSTAAYQGDSKKEVLKILIEQMENPRIKNPDFIFYLDIDIDVALERIQKRSDEKELFEKKESLLRIHNHYKIIQDYFETSDEFELKEMPRWIPLDASVSVDEIKNKILDIIR